MYKHTFLRPRKDAARRGPLRPLPRRRKEPSLPFCWGTQSPSAEGFYFGRTADGDICLEEVWLDAQGSLRIGCADDRIAQMSIADYFAWAGPVTFAEPALPGL
jgi:hypothetical protein